MLMYPNVYLLSKWGGVTSFPSWLLLATCSILYFEFTVIILIVFYYNICLLALIYLWMPPKQISYSYPLTPSTHLVKRLHVFGKATILQPRFLQHESCTRWFLQVLPAVKFSTTDSARRLYPSGRSPLSLWKGLYHLSTSVTCLYSHSYNITASLTFAPSSWVPNTLDRREGRGRAHG